MKVIDLAVYLTSAVHVEVRFLAVSVPAPGVRVDGLVVSL